MITKLSHTNHFWDRLRGLLGRTELPLNEGLWIQHCSSIHTCFMNFPIDVVFVDKELIVRAIHAHLKPWRMTLPKRKLYSVFELPSGTLSKSQTEIGDQLDVVTKNS